MSVSAVKHENLQYVNYFICNKITQMFNSEFSKLNIVNNKLVKMVAAKKLSTETLEYTFDKFL